MRTLLGQSREIGSQFGPLSADVGAQPNEVRQVGRQRLRLASHVRQNRTEQHGGTQRFERIFGTHEDRGWRPAPHALERCQHFCDDATAALKRARMRSFASIGCNRACGRDPILDQP